MSDMLTQLAAFALSMQVKGVKTATKFIDKSLTVRLTFVGRVDRRNRRVHYALSIGSPNYTEREFIKKCQKAGEPLPVKKVQFKFHPKRKKK